MYKTTTKTRPNTKSKPQNKINPLKIETRFQITNPKIIQSPVPKITTLRNDL